MPNLIFSEESLSYADDKGRFGFADMDGNVIIEAEFDWIVRYFENDVAVVRNVNKYQYIKKW